jgi:hypothetical protein
MAPEPPFSLSRAAFFLHVALFVYFGLKRQGRKFLVTFFSMFFPSKCFSFSPIFPNVLGMPSSLFGSVHVAFNRYAKIGGINIAGMSPRFDNVTRARL